MLAQINISVAVAVERVQGFLAVNAQSKREGYALSA
jgi:hypothetical protein